MKNYPGLRSLKNPNAALHDALKSITVLTEKLSITGSLCEGESIALMESRWKRLLSAFYDPKKDKFDTTKIP